MALTIFYYIYCCSLLTLTILFFTLGIRKKFYSQSFFFIYLLATLLVDVVVGFAEKILKVDEPNAIRFNFYIIFSILYFNYLYWDKKRWNIFLIILSIFCLFFIYLLKIDLLNNIFDLRLGFIISFYYIIVSLSWLLKKNYYFDGEKIINNPLYWISLSQIVWASFFILRTVPMYYFNDSNKSILSFSKILFIAGNYISIVLYTCAYFKWKKNSYARQD